MFIIQSVELKTTKTGKPYKALTGEYEGKLLKTNMWSDDFDFDSVEVGSQLDRELEQNGDFWNLKPVIDPINGEVKKSDLINIPKKDISQAQLTAIWDAINAIGKHLNVPYFQKESDKPSYNGLKVEESINPEDIPF